MKEAGCWQIRYGIESGSQEILDLLHKRTTLKQIKNAIELTHANGIESYGFFMIGNPGETKETIKQTIRFAKSLPLEVFKMNFLTPLPGSVLWKDAEKYGSLDRKWNKLSFHIEPAFIPFGLKKEELIYYKKLAFRAFYLRIRIILHYFKRINNKWHMYRLLRGGFSLLTFWCRR